MRFLSSSFSISILKLREGKYIRLIFLSKFEEHSWMQIYQFILCFCILSYDWYADLSTTGTREEITQKRWCKTYSNPSWYSGLIEVVWPLVVKRLSMKRAVSKGFVCLPIGMKTSDRNEPSLTWNKTTRNLF